MAVRWRFFTELRKQRQNVKESQIYKKAAPIKFFYFDIFLTSLKYPIPLKGDAEAVLLHDDLAKNCPNPAGVNGLPAESKVLRPPPKASFHNFPAFLLLILQGRPELPSYLNPM
jgi:hypothetical protein